MAIRSSTLGAAAILPVGGPAGLPGQSTYAAWLALGNVGSLADFVAAQKGTPGSSGASTVGALTDASAAFRALNVLDAATQREILGAAAASDLQAALTVLAGKLATNGDASGTSVTATGAPVAASLADTILLNGVNVFNFVPLASVLAGSDVSAAFQQAINAARAVGRPLIVPGIANGVTFNISSSLDVSGVEIVGAGGAIYTAAAIDLFITTGPSAKVHGLQIAHNGSAGRVFRLDFDAHEIYRNRITAQSSNNSDPVIDFSASNIHIHDNYISNFRPGTLTWRQIRSNTNHISINNQIVRNYMGGTGAGGWIGDNGSAQRPEGTLVAFNESVLTGGPFLTLSSVLSARIIGNMMDQGSSKGALRFEPGGYNGYGIDGVLVQGNYISASSGAGYAAIQNAAGTNGAVASGVRFIGNEIAYGTLAASLVPGISGVFADNYMHGFSAGNAIGLSASSLLSAFDFGSAKQAPNKNLVYVNGTVQAGATRSTVIANYSTASGGGYVQVAHGLAAAPTKFRIGLSTVGTGAAAVQSASAIVGAVDATNVTLAVSVTGIVTQGTIFITLDSEI